MTLTKVEPDRLTVRMDGKEDARSASILPSSGSSTTAMPSRRTAANFDTDSSRSLINNRLAYVAISRASEDARIYTNNAETLGQRLATNVTKTAALEFGSKSEQQQPPPPVETPKTVQVHEYGNPDFRLAAMAADYAARPERSVMVAPEERRHFQILKIPSSLRRNRCSAAKSPFRRSSPCEPTTHCQGREVKVSLRSKRATDR